MLEAKVSENQLTFSQEKQFTINKDVLSLLEKGDIIQIHRNGKSDLPLIDIEGKLIKKSGKIIKLAGLEDVGVHTGHPPHVRLAKKEKWQIVYERLDYYLMFYDKHEKNYYVLPKDILLPALGDLTQSLLKKNGAVLLDNFEIPDGYITYRWDSDFPFSNFSKGKLQICQKCLRKRKSDELITL